MSTTLAHDAIWLEQRLKVRERGPAALKAEPQAGVLHGVKSRDWLAEPAQTEAPFHQRPTRSNRANLDAGYATAIADNGRVLTPNRRPEVLLQAFSETVSVPGLRLSMVLPR